MNTVIPTWEVMPTPSIWDKDGSITNWLWDSIKPLPPFMVADGSQRASQQTTTRVCYDQTALYIRYDCEDRDIWGTYTERDQPIYDEEVVEIFIGQGDDAPVRYFEFQVSPNNVLFDARIYNPTSQRTELQVSHEWNCPRIRWAAQRHDDVHQWWAVLVIPWQGLDIFGPLPKIWRANFYRIERPRDADPEYSCWSPTMTSPADFHKPAYFGRLNLS